MEITFPTKNIKGEKYTILEVKEVESLSRYNPGLLEAMVNNQKVCILNVSLFSVMPTRESGYESYGKVWLRFGRVISIIFDSHEAAPREPGVTLYGTGKYQNGHVLMVHTKHIK